MRNPEAKKLLKEIADDIRRTIIREQRDDKIEFVLNLAAVVEHMDPDMLKG